MDTKLKDLIINEVTEEKLKELEDTNAIPPNELFVTEDEDEASGGSSFVVDSELSTESENPVANKVVTKKFNDIEPGVLFAESEIQKSKNLFDINAPFFWAVGHTFVNGNTITVEAGGSTETDAVFGLIPVKENTTYYIGANASHKRLLFRIYDENKNVITSRIPNWQYNQYWEGSYADFPSTEIRTQLTIPQGAKYLAFSTAWLSSEQTFSNLIISEYPDVDNYQPYNGAIVHEKEIAGLKGQVLWENSTPTVDFVGQTVTLSTDDYDYLEIIYRYSTDYDWQQSMFVEKGAQSLLQTINTPDMLLARITGTVGGNSLQFEKAFLGQNGHEGVYNNYLIPVKIIGYKRS